MVERAWQMKDLLAIIKSIRKQLRKRDAEVVKLKAAVIYEKAEVQRLAELLRQRRLGK